MLDEREGPVPTGGPGALVHPQPPWQRILVLLAGPGFNIALRHPACLWGCSGSRGVTDVQPSSGDVTRGLDRRRAAGLRSGDEIVSLNGAPVGGQRDVVFGLLDAMSSSGEAAVRVRGAEGGDAHRDDLSVPDADAAAPPDRAVGSLLGPGVRVLDSAIPAVLGRSRPADRRPGRACKAGDRFSRSTASRVDDFRTCWPLIDAHPARRVALDYRRGGVAAQRCGGGRARSGRTASRRPHPGRAGASRHEASRRHGACTSTYRPLAALGARRRRPGT